MGIIILIIAAAIEITIMVLCVKTKSNQNKIRSCIRLIVFGIFVLFVFISLIQWSFRWKLLALVLSILAIISCISIIRNNQDKKIYKPVRTIFKGIAMWLIIVIALIPALIFPQYKEIKITGQYKINTAVYTYTDNKHVETFNDKGEKRKVTVEFWYPAEIKDRQPLVVFSHGAFGIGTSNTSTCENLASNGYVVCSISHPYHSMLTIDTDGNFTMVDKSFVQEIVDVNNSVYDEKTSYKIEQKWMKVRTDDMNFVLDTIISYAKDGNSDNIYQLIDVNKIGLMGHSLGGAASAKIGRNRKDIKSVINLDADLLGEYGFKDGEHIINQEIYPTPILSIYTDDMKKLLDGVKDSNFIKHRKMLADNTHDAYEVHIAGTSHLSLTDLPMFSPFIMRMISNQVEKVGIKQKANKFYVVETMNSIVLKFFDYYLKDKGIFHPKSIY
ncbi:acetylhydrolase [Clostridiaceae bacterium M8S5]|nr:acetylhydrolase [Clostridiaceae bacterium M8S5]